MGSRTPLRKEYTRESSEYRLRLRCFEFSLFGEFLRDLIQDEPEMRDDFSVADFHLVRSLLVLICMCCASQNLVPSPNRGTLLIWQVCAFYRGWHQELITFECGIKLRHLFLMTRLQSFSKGVICLACFWYQKNKPICQNVFHRIAQLKAFRSGATINFVQQKARVASCFVRVATEVKLRTLRWSENTWGSLQLMCVLTSTNMTFLRRFIRIDFEEWKPNICAL